jgi:hypothetical protein
MFQVIAVLINDRAATEASRKCGEVVAFNCTGSIDESPVQQATRFAGVFDRNGNAMVDACVKALGATRAAYFIRPF